MFMIHSILLFVFHLSQSAFLHCKNTIDHTQPILFEKKKKHYILISAEKYQSRSPIVIAASAAAASLQKSNNNFFYNLEGSVKNIKQEKKHSVVSKVHFQLDGEITMYPLIQQG
jgi:hypothetical protein